MFINIVAAKGRVSNVCYQLSLFKTKNWYYSSDRSFFLSLNKKYWYNLIAIVLLQLSSKKPYISRFVSNDIKDKWEISWIIIYFAWQGTQTKLLIIRIIWCSNNWCSRWVAIGPILCKQVNIAISHEKRILMGSLNKHDSNTYKNAIPAALEFHIHSQKYKIVWSWS
jgi:hypothetical protein